MLIMDFMEKVYATDLYNEGKLVIVRGNGKRIEYTKIEQVTRHGKSLTISFLDGTSESVDLSEGDRVNGIDPREFGVNLDGCYLTSACVKTKNLPDNCEELTTLRNFRDTFVRTTKNGLADLEHYYSTAPKIVRSINRKSNSNEVFQNLYYTLVRPSVKLIHNNQYTEAYNLYKKIAVQLEKNYL